MTRLPTRPQSTHKPLPPTRRQSGKAQRRDRIVRATSRLLRERALPDLSVRAIAAEAGVCAATVYNLFGTKTALLDAIYERDSQAFQTRLLGLANADGLDRLFDGIRLSAQSYRAEPQFYRSVLCNPATDTESAQPATRLFAIRVAFWRRLVDVAIEDGSLRRNADAERISIALTHIASGALFYWVSNLITVDQFEDQALTGIAMLLSNYDTPQSRGRLAALLNPVRDPPSLVAAS